MGSNSWREALDRALNELESAEQAFEWSDPDFCDYHIYRIQAARAKVSLILGQARLAYGLNNAPRSLTGTKKLQAITDGENEETLAEIRS